MVQFLIAQCAHCEAECTCSKTMVHDRADLGLPISLMGSHMQHKDQWMATIRNMDMRMSGIYKNSDMIGISDVHKTHMMAPLSMNNSMKMIGIMKPAEDHTWMLMVSHHDKEMFMQNRMGMKSKTVSKGLGDMTVSYNKGIVTNKTRKSFWTLGLSVPTGDTDKMDNNMKLPYGMQLGSGTWDFKPSFTNTVYNDNHSFGYRVSSILRNGDNDENYSLGNRYEADIWYAMNRTKRFSPSIRFNYVDQKAIDGIDSTLNMMMTPMNNGTNYAYKRLSLAIGFNAIVDESGTISVEYQLPLHQDMGGVALGLESMLVVAYKHLF